MPSNGRTQERRRVNSFIRPRYIQHLEYSRKLCMSILQNISEFGWWAEISSKYALGRRKLTFPVNWQCSFIPTVEDGSSWRSMKEKKPTVTTPFPVILLAWFGYSSIFSVDVAWFTCLIPVPVPNKPNKKKVNKCALLWRKLLPAILLFHPDTLFRDSAELCFGFAYFSVKDVTFHIFSRGWSSLFCQQKVHVQFRLDTYMAM